MVTRSWILDAWCRSICGQATSEARDTHRSSALPGGRGRPPLHEFLLYRHFRSRYEISSIPCSASISLAPGRVSTRSSVSRDSRSRVFAARRSASL
jgi:hypothetical protein